VWVCNADIVLPELGKRTMNPEVVALLGLDDASRV